MIVVSLVEVIGIASIAPFMAVLADPEIIQKNQIMNSVFNFFSFSNENEFLQFLGVLVLILLVVGNALVVFVNWLAASFGANLGRLLTVSLLKSYLNKPYLFHTINNSTILEKNISQEVWRVSNNIILQMLTLNSKLFTIAFVVIGLFLVNPKFSAIVFGVLVVCYGIIYLLIKNKLQLNSREMSRLLGLRAKAIHEGLGGIKEVKINSKESYYVKIVDLIMSQYSKIVVHNSIIPMVPRHILEVFALGGVVLSAIYFMRSGTVLAEFLPVLSVFAMAGYKLMPAFQAAFGAITTIKSSLFAFDLVFEDLMESDFHLDMKLHKEKTEFKFSSLEIKQVSFKYPNASSSVFTDLNIKLDANKVYAFIGESGSGKSTIVDIIVGLLKPTSGEVLIDNSPLQGDFLKCWQKEIGYVPQTIYLRDGSFAENIAFGLEKSEIDYEMIKVSARLAQIDKFIEGKPEGYNTSVGERGIQISGGQRQRIAIARALYNQASILIFDEATSALDQLTEKEIMQSIEALSGKKTIIIIAHRISTLKKCDKIFLVKEGKIMASGTYNELLETNSSFQKMANV